MFTVYWVNQMEHIIEQQDTSYETLEQAVQSIKDWWQSSDCKPRYYRVIDNGKSFIVDYGLCDCFYEIVKDGE